MKFIRGDPKVGGSKPSSAKFHFLSWFLRKIIFSHLADLNLNKHFFILKNKFNYAYYKQLINLTLYYNNVDKTCIKINYDYKLS